MKMPALTHACSERGAQMARRSYYQGDFDLQVFYASVPLVEGYDAGGAYWGLPENLWRAWAPASEFYDEVDVFFRCEDSHEELTAHLTELMPACKPVFAGLQPEDVAIGFFTALEWLNQEDEDIGFEGGENPDDRTQVKVVEACQKFIEAASTAGLLGEWLDSALFGHTLYLDFSGCGSGFHDYNQAELSYLVNRVMGYSEQMEICVDPDTHTYNIHGSLLKCT